MKSPNKTARNLTGKQHEAAALLAEDCFTDEKIAESVGVTRSTIADWKKIPEFAGLVSEISGTYGQRAIKHGIARKERRLRVLNDIHDAILRVFQERANSKELAKVPGGKTGLVNKDSELDVASIRELRGIQEQVAEELGQKIERSKVEFGDVSKAFESRSEQELEYFVGHHHWPEEACSCKVQ